MLQALPATGMVSLLFLSQRRRLAHHTGLTTQQPPARNANTEMADEMEDEARIMGQMTTLQDSTRCWKW